MADTDLPRDAAKILQQAADATRYSRKEYSLTSDQIRVLAKSFNQMQDSASSASKKIVDAASSMSDAFAESSKTLLSFTKSGISTGTELQMLFGAIAGMMIDAPVKRLNDELSKEKKILDDIVKEQNKIVDNTEREKKISEDSVSRLKDKISKEEQYCVKKAKCDESAIASLKEQLKNEEGLLKDKNDAFNKAKEQLGIDNESVKKQKDKVKGIQDQIAKYESIKKLAGDILNIFSDAFDRFVDLDRAAFEFRNSTKLMRDQMVDIERAALNVNQELVSQGVSIDKAYKSAEALFNTFQNVQVVTQDQIKAVSQLSTNLGVSESNAAGFLQKMENVGGLTEKQSIGMAGIAAGAAKAAGVPLDKVMHDVANASDTTLSMMKGNVRQMTLAAIQAQRMGVSLEKAANSARGLLNFQESVDAEMEASVLLGKNLNMNYARQLSWAGDIAGAQKEIVNQVRSMGDFTKMNVFQQEALAKATGYSVSDLTAMLKNEEKLSKLKPEQRKAYEDATKAIKEQKEETGEQLLQQAQMQSAMQQLSNTFTSFKQILADILTPVVNVAVKLLIPVLKLALVIFNAILIPVKILAKALYAMWEPLEPIVQSINDVFDSINGKIEKIVQYSVDLGVALIKVSFPIKLIFSMFSGLQNVVRLIGITIRGIGGSLSRVGGIIGSIGDAFVFIGKQISVVGKSGNILLPIFNATAAIFSRISAIASGLLGPIRGLITGLGSASGMVGRFASGFGSVGRLVGLLGTAGKAIPIIGWVITGLQAVWGLISRLMKGMNFFDALGETLYDVFVAPFEMIFGLLAKIPVIGLVFQPILKLFPLIKSAVTSFFGYFTTVWESLKNVFSGKDIMKNLMTIGKTIVSILFPIPMMIVKSVISIFPKLWESVKSFFGNVIDKIKSLFSGGGDLIGSLIGFMTFIPKMVLGNVVWFLSTVPKLLFGGIFTAITNIATTIWDVLTGVFTKVKEWFSSFNLFGGLFSGITSVGGGLLSGLTSGISSVVNGVGSTISNDTTQNKPTATTVTDTNTDVISAIKETNQKLDMLISLMSNGGIGVYLDGRKVSEQLANASY